MCDIYTIYNKNIKPYLNFKMYNNNNHTSGNITSQFLLQHG